MKTVGSTNKEFDKTWDKNAIFTSLNKLSKSYMGFGLCDDKKACMEKQQDGADSEKKR